MVLYFKIRDLKWKLRPGEGGAIREDLLEASKKCDALDRLRGSRVRWSVHGGMAFSLTGQIFVALSGLPDAGMGGCYYCHPWCRQFVVKKQIAEVRGGEEAGEISKYCYNH